MTSRAAVAAVVAALVLGISGCGGETTEDVTAPEPGETGSTAIERAVDSVTVHQSGGLAGVRRTWQVNAGASNAERVFDAAGANGMTAAATDASVAPTVPCCDFFVYDITIRYSDGRALRVRTSDAERRPDPAVTRLLNAVLAGDPPISLR